jgi:4-hydroxythreonine-4-phosphate dehydrogenase
MPEAGIIITSGEPAGVGPDIIAALDPSRFDARLIVTGDRELLGARAVALGAKFSWSDYGAGRASGQIELIHQPLATASHPGKPDPDNANYVLKMLDRACGGCLDGEFSAMVTAPLQKEVINRAGVPFSGHTEYLAEACAAPRPVMLLSSGELRVALVTTHLPLREVADAISGESIREVIEILADGLRDHFALEHPRIKVCGLNPHAGENGYLGREEIDIIIPALDGLRRQGLDVQGPFPADTLFTRRMLEDADAVVAMYHDQGLPVLKHAGFHNAVNTTLGLPIVRTSVDHGTALDLAGSGRASPDSLFAAIDSAILQAHNRAAATG